jgi:hypothetical protein
MAHKDPFTLDLFSNTSLASGLGLGVTAFPTTFKADIAITPPCRRSSTLPMDGMPRSTCVWSTRRRE